MLKRRDNTALCFSQYKNRCALTTNRTDRININNMPLDECDSEFYSNIRLVWHRRDLRLVDNPLYSNLSATATSTTAHATLNTKVLSVYVFDESYFNLRPTTCCPKKWDTVLTGPHASRILIEAVSELRNSIRSIGGELLVRFGDPKAIVPQLSRQIGATEIWWSEEPGTYEQQLSQSMKDHFVTATCNRTIQVERKIIITTPVKVVTKIGYTLYHPDDLPRGPDEWTNLAHPKQKQAANQKKQKKFKSKRSSELDTSKDNCTTVVDLSVERFEGMSQIMGDFRKAARASTAVRKSSPAPLSFSQPLTADVVEPGVIPALEALLAPLLRHENPSQGRCRRSILGILPKTIELALSSALSRHEDNCADTRDRNITRGGEVEALSRLHCFVKGGRGEEGHAATADRNMADVSNENSSKLAVHLALGTLSPRIVYESAVQAGEGCAWLISHMEMRDFFLFVAFSSGSRLFYQKGLPVGKKNKPKQTWYDPSDTTSVNGAPRCNKTTKVDQWQKWAGGETGLPLVDAAMVELITTGYCSNRVRQNVASVLAKDLEIDWRAGAEWFQFLLEDYCVGANWGNWLYFSGVGPDPKNRHFRTVSQALRYDPDGTYVKKWLPTLSNDNILSNDDAKEGLFRPWDYIVSWNEVIVDPMTQLTWQDLQRFQQTGKLCPKDMDDDTSGGNQAE